MSSHVHAHTGAATSNISIPIAQHYTRYFVHEVSCMQLICVIFTVDFTLKIIRIKNFRVDKFSWFV